MRKRPRWIWILIVAAGIFAGMVWFGTLQQPLIDRHEFRQTQTALSALFMQPGLDGLIDYQTPVLGAPWSIPFEFPVFQWISRLIADHSGLSLSSSGRLLSVLFGIGCLWPAIRLMQRFSLSFTAIGLFIALYCTSSIYLYWNRAFLMESTALFFTLTSLDFYSSLRIQHPDRKPVIALALTGFFISLSLGLLVKATTALPALILVGADWIWQSRNTFLHRKGVPQHIALGVAMGAAFALLYSWTHHADALKQLNPVGTQLTSSALRHWNFGELNQRWEPELWREVLMERMLTPAASLPAATLITAGLLISEKTQRRFIIASLFLTFLPLLLFTNLHLVHTYYQASNQIYLLMAIAGSTATVLDHTSRRTIGQALALAAVTIVFIANLNSFYSNDWPRTQRNKSDKLTIGRLIQKSTPVNSGLLVFGDDWSSSFAYHSQRRAFTKPDWPTLGISAADVLAKPARYLGDLLLGAVISRASIRAEILPKSCQSAKPRMIKRWHVYLCEPLNAPPL